MKSSRNRILALGGLVLIGFAARADLPRWLQDLRFSDRYQEIFTTTLQTSVGPVSVRRTPRETRDALSHILAATPSDADLYALRARAEEEQLDFTAAETDWVAYAKLAADPGAGQLALADFYHRRLRPEDEVRALAAAAQAQNPASEHLLPASRQRAWRAFERLLALIDAQALPTESGAAQYRLWIQRYPRAHSVYGRFLNYLISKKDDKAAESVIAQYAKAFPADTVFPVNARARLAETRGSAAQAVAVYDRAFTPLWPAQLVKDYFALLTRTHGLRTYLGNARTALAANSADLDAACRIFYYYQQQGNLPAAQRVLIEFRQHKDAKQSAWTAKELWTLGSLLDAVHSYDDAARNYHALYALAGATPADQERALAALIRILFTAPDQPIRFGSGDLSYYKDIATMDPHPGFLNGIVSLLLNSTDPHWRFQNQEQTAVAYFHRARAAELLSLFATKFPNSSRRPALTAQLVDAYAAYADNDGVIRAGKQFLAAFPKARQRTAVALRMAEAYARKNQPQNEFLTYDALLKELAERAEGVPLGDTAAEAPAEPETSTSDEAAEPAPTATPAQKTARSADYARVLDRYISRLLSMNRRLDALCLLRRELDRNPNDPGLYARLASFLEQNHLETEIEQVYQRALNQFSTMSWYDKLGRWYVRRKQTGEFVSLTRKIVDIFAGTELERYFSNVVGTANVTPAISLALNRYAHERFPYDLQFVRSLIYAYSTRETADPTARERLLRSYWFHADDLRAQYFAMLSSSGRLDSELKALQSAAAQNPAVARFSAEADAWRSHFEGAAAGFETAAAQFPADANVVARAVSLDRSLAAFDPQYTARAVAIAEKRQRFEPRSRELLTGIGEIYADREQFAQSRTWWDRIPQIEPGKPGGYLEAATVFWDYYQFEDALRCIAQARKQTGNASLYAYEAGAIYENKRDFPRAIAEYMKGAGATGAARSRLVVLARRPAYQAEIDKLTAAQVAGPNPAASAVSLRIEILDTQNRRAEVESLLADLGGRVTSVDLLATIRSQAESRGSDAATARLLEREAEVTTDPVDRMRAQLALMRFYEGKAETAKARHVVELLYRANPAILGVVRATVDFYWRNKQPREAIDTLARVASASNPAFAKRFTLEASAKSTESGEYARARQFASALLKDDPYNAEYIASMAAAYSREGDDHGLRTFYEDRIDAIRKSSLSADDRTARLAGLRRNLIPVLTRARDFAGGVDQYIEILRSYPEDDAVAREAALYADRHNSRDRLLAYFTKAVSDSPRDFRWPLVLARVQTAFEDLPAAITTYTRAAAIRPDRTDVLIARVSLEERLMRFDEALKTYTKLYDLTYHNPQWMEKAAEVHARLGHKDEAVKALRVAFLEGRPERPRPFFEIARILDSYDLLTDARTFAERGMTLAGGDLFREYGEGAATYARVMTRLRLHEVAFERLRATAESESNVSAFRAVGETAARYFTPEEKSALQAFFEKEKTAFSIERLLLVIQAAGMSGLEAKLHFEFLMSNPQAEAHLSQLIRLQNQRLKFDELGLQIEAVWQVYPNDEHKDSLLDRAAEAYRHAGNAGAELRVLALHRGRSSMDDQTLSRYFELLAALAPDRLVAESRGSNSAVSAALAHASPKVAFEAIRARGTGQKPVWSPAYTALAGLYLGEHSSAIETAFTSILGDATIGERLGRHIDRNVQLAGSTWFYYGTAYGEYASADDFLPALLEGTPARADAYSTLADYSRENRAFARALEDYEHVLELAPDRGGTHDRMAVILWEQGKHDEAIAHWKAAFAAFRRAEDSRLAESFWQELPAALENVGSRNLLAQVRTEADAALRIYIRRNGYYRVEPLVEGVLKAAAGSTEGVNWILDLSRVAPDPLGFLESAADSAQLATAQREILYQRVLALAASAAAEPGAAHEYAVQRLESWQVKWVWFLRNARQPDRAQAAFGALPKTVQQRETDLAITLAADSGHVSGLIASYAKNPEQAPSAEVLTRVAASLPKPDAQRLLEFVYTRELDSRNLTAANFLGLAEIRIEQRNLPAALALLRRMTLVADEPFQDLAPAAALLEKSGHAAEAREFLTARVKAVPWDMESRARLGDTAVARSGAAAYADRILAARGTAAGTNLGSAELDLLAGGAHPAPPAGGQPYFYEARLQAAEGPVDAATRTQLLAAAVAIHPEDKTVRMRLFHAAVASGNPRLAVSAARAPGEYSVDFQATGHELALAYRQFAEAQAKLDMLPEAASSYQDSLRTEPSKDVETALAAVKAEWQRREENERRRPVIADGIEQARLVQTRLEGGLAR